MYSPVSTSDRCELEEISAHDGAKPTEKNGQLAEYKKDEVEHKPHPKYPKQVFFIVVNEFCERFCYYGMRTILSLYLANILLYSESDSKVIYHTFIMFTYFFPILGAIISDSWWGKFNTIMYVSIIYAIGNTVLAVAAIGSIGIPQREISMLGLFLIAVGTGGIKPCVAAFGGDQFQLPEQELQLAAFFSMFYFSINSGSLISTFLTPVLRKDVQCFDADTCYPLAFAVPGILMFVAIVVFALGKPLYKILTPKGNIMVKIGNCMTYAIKQRSKSEKKRDHWLDYSREKFGDTLVDDIQITLKVLVLYLPLPIFWALYDQQGSGWTFQAVRMNGDIGFYTILPDQMQLVNPLLILAFIPLFTYVVYPLFDKCHFLQSPLKRMVCGGLLAAAAFAISACVSLVLESTYPELPSEGNAQVRLFNPQNCDATIDSNFFDVPLKLNSMGYKEFKFELDGTRTSPYTLTCGSKSIKGDITVYEKEATGYFVNTNFNLQDFEDDIDKSGDGFPKIRFLAVNNAAAAEIKILDSDGEVEKSIQANNDTQFTISPGIYTIKDFKKKELDVGLGGVYTILLDYNEKIVTMHTITDINSVHILWLIPQYVVITAGEIMFSVTGLEFSYSQAPVSMKSFLQACWLLTTAFGNLIIVLIESAKIFEDQSSDFFLYTALMVVDMILFAFLAYRYQYVEPPQSKDEDAAIEAS